MSEKRNVPVHAKAGNEMVATLAPSSPNAPLVVQTTLALLQSIQGQSSEPTHK